MPPESRFDAFHARPGFLLKRAQQVAAAIFAEECRAFGMTSSQYGALCALREFGGIDQIALGTLIGADRSTISLVVRLLMARGYVLRAHDERDRRRVVLRLTPAGRRVLSRLATAARRVSARILSVLPRSERGRLLDLLVRLLDGHGAIVDVAQVLEGKLDLRKPPRRTTGVRRRGAKPRRRAPSGTR